MGGVSCPAGVTTEFPHFRKDLDKKDLWGKFSIGTYSGMTVLRFQGEGIESSTSEGCFVVPFKMRSKFMSIYHDAPTAGHFGASRTLEKLMKRVWWPAMASDVEDIAKP